MRWIPILLAMLLLAGTAQAHTSQETDDGLIKIVVGNLNEPTTTWMKTGLDVRLSYVSNGTAVLNAHTTLEARLESPSGEILEQDLKGQHGVPGGYTMLEPYYLTEPGQYKLHLKGTIAGSPVDGHFNVAGPVPDWSGQMFPETPLLNPKETTENLTAAQAKITALESQLATLKADYAILGDRIAALEKENEETPGFTPALLVAGIAAAVLLARRN
ncbi:MAG: hypothetical protein ACPHK8_06780 [Thermoplasmatota archaeon]